MKKLLFWLIVVVIFVGLTNCKSTASGPKTQEEVDTALREIYSTYQPKLDMSGAKEYTVVWGDTLSQITRKYYGDLINVGEAGPHNGFYFPVIMLASPDSHIVDPDMIVPGLTLKVIDLKKNLSDPDARKAIKDSLMAVASIYHAKDKPMEEAGLIKLSNSL